MFYEDIELIVRNITNSIVNNDFNIFIIEPYNEYQHFRLYLKSNLDFDTHTHTFFSQWFSNQFNYLKTKYNGSLKNNAIQLNIIHDIKSTFEHLYLNNKLSSSMFDFYFDNKLD